MLKYNQYLLSRTGLSRYNYIYLRITPHPKRFVEFINKPPRIEYVFLFTINWYLNEVKDSTPDKDGRRNIHIYFKDQFKMTSEDILIEGDLQIMNLMMEKKLKPITGQLFPLKN